MDWKEVLYWFSDSNINSMLNIAFVDFKVMMAVFGSPLVWWLAKIARWTPWQADDKIIEKLSERLGLPGK